ncbi:MAG TPA: hypothetical protein VFU02_05335 [Polyangiaceae bacterium]|nr:hypothetical protein [Polyangiaceae bacterium]
MASRRLPIEFLPVALAATPDNAPHLEVQAPVSGKKIDLAQAEAYQVRVKATSWSDGLSLVMLLDDYPPRVFRDPQKPVPLAQLWPAHREIEPGLHRLFAAVQLPDGTTLERELTGAPAPFAYLPFWVGPDDEALEAGAMREATAPGVILLAPRGTFNGNAAADQVLLDYQVLGITPGAAPPKVKVEVIVEGETYAAELGASEVRRIAGLPSGDHLVRIALLESDGQPSNARYAAASRVITVNRDAPVE